MRSRLLVEMFLKTNDILCGNLGCKIGSRIIMVLLALGCSSFLKAAQTPLINYGSFVYIQSGNGKYAYVTDPTNCYVNCDASTIPSVNGLFIIQSSSNPSSVTVSSGDLINIVAYSPVRGIGGQYWMIANSYRDSNAPPSNIICDVRVGAMSDMSTFMISTAPASTTGSQVHSTDLVYIYSSSNNKFDLVYMNDPVPVINVNNWGIMPLDTSAGVVFKFIDATASVFQAVLAAATPSGASAPTIGRSRDGWEPTSIRPPTLFGIINYPGFYNSTLLPDLMFSTIGKFFSNNVPIATDQATLSALQALLRSDNLKNFLTAAEQGTLTSTLLPAVNTALTSSTVAGGAQTAMVEDTRLRTAALEGGTTQLPVITNVSNAAGSSSTAPTTVSIDTTIQNAIATALKSSTIASRVAALTTIATTYKTATVLPATQTAFAAAIMNVGGTYIHTNFKTLNTFYAKIYAEVKAKKKVSAADKAYIKKIMPLYTKAVGGNLKNFQTLLTNSLKTGLLTGPVTTSTSNKYFVQNCLILTLTILNYLGSIK